MSNNVVRLPWRRPPLIECPDCGRLMSDVQQGGNVLERFCFPCDVTYTNPNYQSTPDPLSTDGNDPSPLEEL